MEEIQSKLASLSINEENTSIEVEEILEIDSNETNLSIREEKKSIQTDQTKYFLFLGETGAGKSTAIEKFCDVGNERISSDGIHSDTKKVTSYKSNKLEDAEFLDTAGFGDSDGDDGIQLDDVVETCQRYSILVITFILRMSFDLS
jgi:predicted GTPase